MQQKYISGRDLSNTVTSEDILGKEVIDIDGTFIGVIEKVLIDPETLDFVGISIDKGFLKRGLTIGKNYINKITKNAVFLKIKVAYEVKGKIVFDREGVSLGTVSSIELNGNRNSIASIIIRSGMLLKKELIVPAEYIETIGENVMLKVTKKKLAQNTVVQATTS